MKRSAVIPVRSGSKRLPKKNYKDFNSRNLAEIARDKCLASGIFDEVVISSDDPFFEELINCNKVKFLKRSEDLAGDEATTDLVIDFFFKEFSDCESILWVNSVSPLQPVQDIKNCGLSLNRSDVDCVMAVNTLYQHCCISNQPLNFDPKNPFEKTQDLEPIKLFVPSLMGWDSKTFRKNYLKNKFSFFNGNVGYYEIKSKLSALVIKNEQDFKLIRSVIEGFTNYNKKVEYYM